MTLVDGGVAYWSLSILKTLHSDSIACNARFRTAVLDPPNCTNSGDALPAPNRLEIVRHVHYLHTCSMTPVQQLLRVLRVAL